MGRKERRELDKLSEEEKVELVAACIGNIFQASAPLVFQLPTLQKIVEAQTGNYEQTKKTAHLHLEVGVDYEKQHLNVKLQMRRSQAIYDMVKVFKETQDEIDQYEDQQRVRKMLGGK